MKLDKRHAVVLALTGGAVAFTVALTAFISRRRNQQEKAREHQNALEVWENEGGIVRSSTAQAAEAR